MIVVVGSINMDIVINVEKIPQLGETVMGQDAIHVPGGKGANQAAAIAKLGRDVKLIGAVGTDSDGDFLIEYIKGSGVDTSYILKKDIAFTGMAFIVVDSNGDNVITVTPGANFKLTPEDIEHSYSAIQAAQILLVQLEIPLDTARKALEMAKAYGKMTILNPAPGTLLESHIYSLADILTPNKMELGCLSGIDIDSDEDVVRACGILRAQGASTIIVTLGSEGSFLYDSNGGEFIPATEVDAVDSTAAGDAYSAALAFYIARMEGQCQMRDAAKFASLAGALTVTRAGALPSLPSAEELENFLKNL